jgi:hypothetical protein
VSSSSVFNCFLAIVFLLSVAWKIAIPSINDNDLKDDLVEFLERNHFDIVVTERRAGVPVIQAKTASCQLRIAGLRANGSDRDLVQHLARGADRLFVVFRGRVYSQQPVLLTLTNTLWSMCLRKLGLIKYIAPVIAVAANSSCDAERLPWGELRGVP